MMKHTITIAAIFALAGGGCAMGQSLFQQPVEREAPVRSDAAAQANAQPPSHAAAQPPQPPQQQVRPQPQQPARNRAPSLESVSMFVVIPPPPRTFEKHDKVQVIINESTLQRFEQSLETEKDVQLRAQLRGLPSVSELLQARLRPGEAELINSTGRISQDYEGDGAYERRNRFTARITAEVLEVKPNGHLVLEARTVIASDREEYVLVVAGVCDPEDITRNRTIQSAQLANLIIRVQHEGDVRKASDKGVLTRVLDAIFNF